LKSIFINTVKNAVISIVAEVGYGSIRKPVMVKNLHSQLRVVPILLLPLFLLLPIRVA
jgi:hypothetical protein